MTVLILDNNLIWSAKLARSVRALGHEPVLIDTLPDEWPQADLAILNLGNPTLFSGEIVSALRDNGIKTLAHAGHKEQPLLEAGNTCGCDRVVTNGTITHKLGDLLAELKPKP